MSLLLLALVPSLAVLYYYYNKDRHPEPWRIVGGVFVLGALSIFVARPLERLALSFKPRGTSPCSPIAVYLECLLVPGLVEESVKLLVVLIAAFPRKDFDEPIDGLIYSTAAAMGFTFAEDWYWYVTASGDWRRMFGAFAHAWFSCAWGACVGRARFMRASSGVPMVLLGLAASIFLHGIYDFLVVLSRCGEPMVWVRHLLAPLLLALYLVFDRQLSVLSRARQA
jgi:RsiW-degrading membrane proteinase PrsW (M82 family)